MKKTVVIVDDHLLIAKAISSIIDHFGGFSVLYEVENGKRLMERLAIAANIPDVILLDISMPEMNGFETALWLREHHPGIKVMALTMQGDEESLIKMIRNGAAGYLNKNVHPTELEQALLQVLEKGFYYPDWAASKVLRGLMNNADKQEIKLTDRETELLKLVCTELTYKEIADRMNCSPRTVESFRDALFEKLGVRTRVALALYAVKKGLIHL